MTSSFGKFYLLLWKNYKIQTRHKIQAIFEIGVPIAFIILLAFLRGLVEIQSYPAKQFEAFSPSCG
jgi:ATP-binding cassette subfamily A (ABC1) protein 3